MLQVQAVDIIALRNAKSMNSVGSLEINHKNQFVDEKQEYSRRLQTIFGDSIFTQTEDNFNMYGDTWT